MTLNNKKLIIFDLDGTLIDSVPDIARAVNKMMIELGRASYSVEAIRGWVGNGGKVLVKRALAGKSEVDDDFNTPDFQTAFNLFLEKYREQTCKDTFLYPNVRTTLKALAEQSFRMAIVTNKPGQFVAPILKKLDIAQYFEMHIGGDTLPKKKPDAMPLLHVCNQLQVSVKETVMVGDSRNDILAARHADMDSIGLTYGYNYGESISTYQPSVVVSDFGDILKYIK